MSSTASALLYSRGKKRFWKLFLGLFSFKSAARNKVLFNKEYVVEKNPSRYLLYIGIAISVIPLLLVSLYLLQMDELLGDIPKGTFIIVLLLLQFLFMYFLLTKLATVHKSLNTTILCTDSLIDGLPEALLFVNEDGKIIRTNNSALEAFGYSSEQLINQKVEKLISGRYPKMLIELSQAYKHSKGNVSRPKRLNLIGLKKDGSEIEVEISLFHLAHADQPLVVLVITDVTQQHIYHEVIRHAQRMEAVGQLTTGVAHDFNNILTTILGNTECAEIYINDKEKTKQHLNSVKEAVERASFLTYRLLAFNRKQPLKEQALNILELLHELTGLLKRTLGSKINITLHVPDNIWPVFIDKAQFENSILNLCLNAKQAMPDGGKLIIEVKNITVDNSLITEKELPVNDFVEISVDDQGIGIPKDAKDKVFEPFFTTKKAEKGSGLGLTMVYQFIKQSKGTIILNSEEGVGTSIKLFLPRYTTNKD